MSESSDPTPQHLPALVRATESGDFFRGPLAGALRVLAVLGALPVLACFRFAASDIDQVRGPALLLGLASIIAAALAGQVLFGRARRVLEAPAARFPVVPAMRECIRALGEAAFIWSMTLATAGLVTGVWAANELGGDAIPQVIALAIGFLVLGWTGLLLVHLSTELASALVEIANNTEGSITTASALATEQVVARDTDVPASTPVAGANTETSESREGLDRIAADAPDSKMLLLTVGLMIAVAIVVIAAAGGLPSSGAVQGTYTPAPSADEGSAEQQTSSEGATPGQEVTRFSDPRFDGFDAMSDANKLDLLKSVGAQVYANNCAACHQMEGRGLDDIFPPLRGNPLVTAGTPEEHIKVLLHGLSNKPINGVSYAASMPGMGFLSDSDLAAVATYTATAWGNTGPMIVPAQVAAAR